MLSIVLMLAGILSADAAGLIRNISYRCLIVYDYLAIDITYCASNASKFFT